MTPIGTVDKSSDTSKVQRARRVATQAINNAAKIASNEDQNRSTRSRSAYKLKADALDRVARILSGKE